MPLLGNPILSMIAREIVFGNLPAQRLLHPIAQSRRFLDARADRRAQMQANLSGVHGREKIGAEQRHKAHSGAAKTEEQSAEQPADGAGTIRATARSVRAAARISPQNPCESA